MVATFRHSESVRFASWERHRIRMGMRALLALHVLFALFGRLPPSAWIVPAGFVALYNGLFGLVCASAGLGLVAIHHYFIDGAVWKLRNQKVRQELFRHLEARTARAATPRLRN